MTVSVNTMQTEGLGDFFKDLKKRLNAPKQMAKNVFKNPGRVLVFTANIATAAATRNPKNLLSTIPGLISFHNTGKSLYL